MRREAAIERAALWEKVKYKPHGLEQQQFHNSQARFRTAVCGRRFGKSTMAAIDLVEAAFIPDAWYWIVGPDYRLGEKEFRIVYKCFCDTDKLNLGKKIKKSYNAKQGDMRLQLPWNTVIEVVSAKHPDSLQGEGLHGVIMSEAGSHKLQTWEQYIEPALSDNLGWATFPTTPKGFNWLQGMWQLGQLPEMKDYDSWQYPTWLNLLRYPGGFNNDCMHGIDCTCNPELVRINKVASKSYWDQEYGAKFTTFQGQIYDEYDPNIHVIDIDYNPFWKHYWVFDYGFAVPFVCLDIMVDPSDNVYVWREYQVRHRSTWEHAHALKNRDNPEGFHVDAMFGDPRGADEAATIALVLGYVSQRPVPWITGIESVKRGLKLQPDGKPKLYISRKCVELNRQMQGLRIPEAQEGKEPREGQVDYDDHGPDALRYFYSEFFVLGAGTSLAEAYDATDLGTEAESFFTSRASINLDTPVGY